MVIEFSYQESARSAEQPLRSDDHDNCHCVIVYNTTSGEGQMFHVWEGANKGLCEEQKEEAEAFTEQARNKIGMVIEGDRSYLLGEDGKGLAQQYLETLGVEFLSPSIDLKNDGKTWNVVFDPKSRKVSVTAKDGEVLYDGSLFDAAISSPTIYKQADYRSSTLTSQRGPHNSDVHVR